jgi:hypothetical protein
MAGGKWFGARNGQAAPQAQDAAKAASALVITTADGKKFGFENVSASLLSCVVEIV